MKLFLDTEFNELYGVLISMALVAEDDRRFYEVVAVPPNPGPFVVDHVLPKLEKEPIGDQAFRERLVTFLVGFETPEIVADWPADFEHLCHQLTVFSASTGLWVVPVEFSMRLLNTPMLDSKNPHNALSDALALREWWNHR